MSIRNETMAVLIGLALWWLTLLVIDLTDVDVDRWVVAVLFLVFTTPAVMMNIRRWRRTGSS